MRIAKVYVFSNGMCMVFNDRGEQMSEYQGVWEECRPRIEAAKDEGTIIEGAHWGRTGITLMNVGEAEERAEERKVEQPV